MADSDFKLTDVVFLAKLYFLDPEEGVRARLLFLGLLFTIMCSIAFLLLAMHWGGILFSALTVANPVLFYETLKIFLGLFLVQGINYGCSKYFRKELAREWSKCLYKKYLTLYVTEKRYLEIKQNEEIDSPGQRFAVIEEVTEESVSLFSNLLWSGLTFIVFAQSLWVAGGSISFSLFGLSFMVPGYAMWCCIAFAVVSYGITHFLGRALKALLEQEQAVDAKFTKNIQQLTQVAESVVMEQGDAYFKDLLDHNIEAIISNKKAQRVPELSVEIFRDIYYNVSGVFIDAVMSPLYFAGKMTLDQLMQMDMTFYQVLTALNFLMESYEKISEYQAHVTRLMGLIHELEKPVIHHHDKISRQIIKEDQKDCLIFNQVRLSIFKKNEEPLSFPLMNFSIKQGDRVLIIGPSGVGKSTLLKALFNFSFISISEGEIKTPSLEQMYCMPQCPTFTGGTLHQELNYPYAMGSYTLEQCKAVLTQVGLKKFAMEQSLQGELANNLSGGQKQRLGFARLLLRFLYTDNPPKLVLLDECTNAGVDTLYDLFRDRCFEGVTIVSIAHNDVRKYHNRLFEFTEDNQFLENNHFLEEEKHNANNPIVTGL